ncbi:MAG: hypothetical protein WC942_03970 [Clostridia bacterium]|jgi:hypothetical protein
MFKKFNPYCFVSFDGEENIAPEDNKSSGETKTFTQEEVNSILAKEKRKTQEVQKQLLSQLEEAKNTAKLGTEERTNLEKKIEELQKVTMSAEERARQKEVKLQKQYEDQIAQISEEKENWKKRHTDLLISNSILRAASENKAVEPNQLLKMLKSDAKLVQKLDEDGQPINDFDVRMSLLDTDKNGKPIELDLTIGEAVKRMTELPQYGNLFEGGKSGGVGSSNINGKNGARIDVAKLAQENPAAYRELRKSNPAAIFGS